MKLLRPKPCVQFPPGRLQAAQGRCVCAAPLLDERLNEGGLQGLPENMVVWGRQTLERLQNAALPLPVLSWAEHGALVCGG